MSLRGCTGGFMCASREKCPHYLYGEVTDDIRLCGEGEEDPPSLFEYLERVEEPTPIVRVVKKEEREDV